MDKHDLIIVYIDDDKKMHDDALFDYLSESVQAIVKFDKPLEGLTYIKENIAQRMVVILDWKYNNSQRQGADYLSDIKDISELVPVIVFTGQDVSVSDATKMFAGHAFSCLAKSASIEEMEQAIDNAYSTIQNDIRTIMTEWIMAQDEEKRNRPYMRFGDRTYTLNDILVSIRKQDNLGKDTTKGILSLATELFTNNMRK